MIDFSRHFICVDAISIPISIQLWRGTKTYFISFEVIKIKNFLKLRILLYFSYNKRSIPLVSPPGYRPTLIYAHQKRPFSGYKPLKYYICRSEPYLPRGIFAWSCPEGEALCVNPDRKMLLTWYLVQSYFVMLQKNW